MNDDFIYSIKSRGFWRINIRPADRPVRQLTLRECQGLVETQSVSLRGWDYPHIARRQGIDQGMERHDTFVQSWTDWNYHREFWRMYVSGQFLHYRAVGEDWWERDSLTPAAAPWDSEIGNDERVLAVITNLWLIVEVFEFVQRLGRAAEIYRDGISLSLTLHSGDKLRRLWIDARARVPFSHPRMATATSITYEVQVNPSTEQDPKRMAQDAARHIFERFGWDPSDDQLRSDIDKLYRV